jgi:hypothetical protein
LSLINRFSRSPALLLSAALSQGNQRLLPLLTERPVEAGDGYNRVMRDLPNEATAATVLHAITESFRDRMTHQQPPTSEDLAFLQKAVTFYGELCVKEAKNSPEE